MQQGLCLLTQRRHPLQLAQYSQRHEIGHAQHARERLRTVHPRQGIRHGCQQFTQDSLINEVVHQSRRIHQPREPFYWFNGIFHGMSTGVAYGMS